MREEEYTDFLIDNSNIQDTATPQLIQKELNKYINSKIEDFTDLTLTLAHEGLYNIEEKGIFTAQYIDLVADQEQKDLIIQFLESTLKTLKQLRSKNDQLPNKNYLT